MVIEKTAEYYALHTPEFQQNLYNSIPGHINKVAEAYSQQSTNSIKRMNKQAIFSSLVRGLKGAGRWGGEILGKAKGAIHKKWRSVDNTFGFTQVGKSNIKRAKTVARRNAIYDRLGITGKKRSKQLNDIRMTRAEIEQARKFESSLDGIVDHKGLPYKNRQEALDALTHPSEAANKELYARYTKREELLNRHANNIGARRDASGWNGANARGTNNAAGGANNNATRGANNATAGAGADARGAVEREIMDEVAASEKAAKDATKKTSEKATKDATKKTSENGGTDVAGDVKDASNASTEGQTNRPGMFSRELSQLTKDNPGLIYGGGGLIGSKLLSGGGSGSAYPMPIPTPIPMPMPIPTPQPYSAPNISLHYGNGGTS